MLAPGGRGVVLPWIGCGVALVAGGFVFLHGITLAADLALGGAFLAMGLFLLWFFRDPERSPGEGIVSAADGRVVSTSADGDRWQVVVFMSVTDVHVNRLPADARVLSIEDGGEGYRPAFLPDAKHNQRRHYHLATALGPVEVVQLTGAVARRIVSFVGPGFEGKKGDRFGMIVLGSRVDVFLPKEEVRLRVRPGDRVRAGVTPIAQAKR